MFQVTDTAAHVIQMVLESNEVEEGNCLRLVTKAEGNFTFEVVPTDSDEEEDRAFDHEGTRVLIVSREVGDMLGEMTLDAQRDEEGQISLGLIPSEE